MNEKELKKLNRKQLLELLLQQTEHADELQTLLNQTRMELENRILMEKEAGSLAEASLKINGIFSAAQAAADQYLDNIRHIQQLRRKKTEEECLQAARKMMAETRQRCAEYEAEQRRKADRILAQAAEKAAQQEEQSRRTLEEARSLYRRLAELQKKTDPTD